MVQAPVGAGTIGADSASASAAQPPDAPNEPDIIITAPALFRDVRPERQLDDDSIAAYGLSTIDELIAEIQAELGSDEEPVFMVNGERVFDLDDIGAYPVEVIRQLQVLPRGSAAKVGGSPSQRVISLALRRQVKSATGVVAPRTATEGSWNSTRAESIFTHVNGRSRGNATLRVNDESALMESGILQPSARAPFAAEGNVIAYPDLSGEIDPLLSVAAGRTVTVVPVPSVPNPTLADFAALADEENVDDVGDFRTLRPATRRYDFNASYTSPLTSWLTSTATLRFNRTTSRSLLGLPSALFVLEADNPASPFNKPVALAYFGKDALHSRYRRESGEGNVTLTAALGGSWRASFNAKHSRSSDSSRTERSASFAPIALGEADPFRSRLSGQVPVAVDFSRSNYRLTLAQLSVTGSPLSLPAGDPTITLDGQVSWRSIRSSSTFSGRSRDLSRSEQTLRGVIDVPVASRRNEALAEMGELSASAEYAVQRFSDSGSATRSILALTWEPRSFLRLRGALEKSKEPASIEVLGAPTTITPSVRLFDVLTGDTVDVTYVSGGNPGLLPQSTKVKRASAILRLVPRLGLQLTGDYSDMRERNFVTSLPPLSEAVMSAFPDRFVRNSEGTLTLVDARPVNFAERRQRRLRYGLSLNSPLGGGGGGASFTMPSGDGDEAIDQTPPSPAANWPATRLQLTANHSVVLLDQIQIRPGLPVVDLLHGGAVGIPGGRVRHEFDATASISSGGTGIRIGTTWRGESLLHSRIGGEQSLLRFSPVFLVNLRAFADAKRLFPDMGWSSGTRLSVNVVNLTNRRQRVRDPFGNTPLQYQPGYRDPLGRTVELEIRKVF